MIRITKEFLKTHNFKFDGITFPQDITQKSYRPIDGTKLPPSADDQMNTLRKKFATIFTTNYKNFAQLEVRCQINESIMRKYLNRSRKITRESVAKLCVGTPLTLEESDELFTLQGHSLEPDKQRFDALIVNAIQDGDDIGTFLDTCQEYGLNII